MSILKNEKLFISLMFILILLNVPAVFSSGNESGSDEDEIYRELFVPGSAYAKANVDESMIRRPEQIITSKESYDVGSSSNPYVSEQPGSIIGAGTSSYQDNYFGASSYPDDYFGASTNPDDYTMELPYPNPNFGSSPNEDSIPENLTRECREYLEDIYGKNRPARSHFIESFENKTVYDHDSDYYKSYFDYLMKKAILKEEKLLSPELFCQLPEFSELEYCMEALNIILVNEASTMSGKNAFVHLFYYQTRNLLTMEKLFNSRVPTSQDIKIKLKDSDEVKNKKKALKKNHLLLLVIISFFGYYHNQALEVDCSDIPAIIWYCEFEHKYNVK